MAMRGPSDSSEKNGKSYYKGLSTEWYHLIYSNSGYFLKIESTGISAGLELSSGRCTITCITCGKQRYLGN